MSTPPTNRIRASRVNSDRRGRHPNLQRGDVAYGDDPFNGEEDARPWLVLSNHEERPFHGEQYIALTLPSKSWMDGLIEIPEASWIRGGTPDESRIV